MRQTESRAFVNQFLVYSLVAICLSGSIGLGTVWMRHQISLAANANKQLEAKIADVERRIEETAAATAAERDPAVLNRRNAEWRLGLVAPDETLGLKRITEDPLRRLAADQSPLIEGAAPMTFRVALGL